MRYFPVQWLFLFCSLLLPACATYHISTQSLVEQMANSGTEKKTIVGFAPPYFFYKGSVKGNDLTKITCLDKNGKEARIDVTNKTSVRITELDSSRVTFYFNTLIIHDSVITGSKTHFFQWSFKPVMLRDISNIEIQKD
jgi:hypothetical protein